MWCAPPAAAVPLSRVRVPATQKLTRNFSARQVNMQPQSRKARQAQMYREDLEKMRLANRRENFCHYEVRAKRPWRLSALAAASYYSVLIPLLLAVFAAGADHAGQRVAVVHLRGRPLRH